MHTLAREQTHFVQLTPAIRRRLEATLENLIGLLDQLDGDADLDHDSTKLGIADDEGRPAHRLSADRLRGPFSPARRPEPTATPTSASLESRARAVAGPAAAALDGANVGRKAISGETISGGE